MAHDDNVCVLRIGNQDYSVPCSRVGDLQFYDGFLSNFSENSITLRSSWSDETTYPYVRCSAWSVCDYYASRNTYSVAVQDDYSIIDGDLFRTFDYGLLACILIALLVGFRLIWKK